MTDRLMPIMRTGLFVTFDVLDELQAQRNHGQTLLRLASRGGLSPCEALAIAERRPHRREPERQALVALAALSAEFHVTQAARDVLAERQRQISAEGFTHEHDDTDDGDHDRGQIAVAAAAYALTDFPGVGREAAERLWDSAGWDTSYYRPKDRRRNLVKAAALLLAEIERLDRAAAKAAA